MTYEDMIRDSVLKAKCSIACLAKKWYGKEKSGEIVDNCTIEKVIFAYGLIRDLECYEVGGSNNCWDTDDLNKAIRLLNGMF